MFLIELACKLFKQLDYLPKIGYQTIQVRFQYVFIIFISMIQDIHSELSHNYSQKYKANTPATADSLIMESLTSQIFGQSSKSHFQEYDYQETLFTILQQRFQQKIQQPDEPKSYKESIKNVIQEDIDECEFKIRINISTQTGEVVKSFAKNIIKTIEIQDEITLIFDRQHEKLKIQTNDKYIIQVFIQTLDSFSKNIWEQGFKVGENSKKWSVMTISSNEITPNSMCLNVELQKIGKFFIKPLSFKLPIAALDQFFDYKLKLLNKSDILNAVKSISELKGILLPLTKQNMGSRIIQKLLNRAKQNEIQLVISELKPHFEEMIFDRYGNYVFQKIFELSNSFQKVLCFKKLQPSMITLLKCKEGTHSIQALMDHLSIDEISHWFSVFSRQQILDLSKNKFAMHFIQKLLTITPFETLLSTLIEQFKQLANDRQGIVVLKSMMSTYCNDVNIRYKILESCQNCMNQISFTEFGHYIVEEMFQFYSYYQLQNILNYITVYITYFAQNQYSSSIIKKSIETFGDCIAVPAINSIMQNGLRQMMENSSGQFILHRLIQWTKDENSKNQMMSKMIVLSKEVKCYEKKQKWMKYFKLI